MTKRQSRMPLILGYLIVAVAVAVLAALYGSYRVQNLYEQQASDDLEVRARLCAKQIIGLLQEDDTQGVDALCKELGKAVKMRITVIRPGGEVVGDTDNDPTQMEDHSDREEIKQALTTSAGGVGRSTRFSTTMDKTLMYVAVASPTSKSPMAVVRTSVPITTVDERLRGVAETFFVVGVLTVLLIVFAIPWFSIRFTSADEIKKRNRMHDDDPTPQDTPEETP